VLKGSDITRPDISIVPLLNDKTCSSSYGESGVKNCLIARLKFYQFSNTILHDTLVRFDTNNLIRRVIIHAPLNSSMKNTLGASIDEFLRPRLWWIVTHEEFYYYDTLLKSVRLRNQVLIVLSKFHQKWEPLLKRRAALQYPPPSICNISKLTIGSMVNSGWGAQMHMYPFEMDNWVIFNIWDSLSNDPFEAVTYASSSFCPNIINKRLCIVIPLTNCTMPSYLTSLSGEENRDILFPQGDFLKFYNITINSKPISNDEPHFGRIIDHPYYYQLDQLYTKYFENYFDYVNVINSNGESINKSEDDLYNPKVDLVLSTFALHLRLNARMRRLVEQRILKFRYEETIPFFSLRSSCVAIHIRRSDRARGNINMTEFCHQHLPYCKTHEDDIDLSCFALQEFGCTDRYPFGGLSLIDYINKAKLLQPYVENVFIMTDDDAWLHHELSSLVKKNIHIYHIAARDDVRHHDSPNATENGIDFFASLSLIRQCDSFVGHFRSQISDLLYQAMCFHHGSTTGTCPAACDIRK
jgi:hypothetical protein